MTDPFLVGRLIADRYRVVRRLGAGGMGTVYVAVQEPLGREVALKVVRRDLAGDDRAVERFRREAKQLALAAHPNIVTIIDFDELAPKTGDAPDSLYFAMELVRGENLRQRLQRVGALPVKKTIAIVRAISSALACAHQADIIHRDLKPENVLLMEAAGHPDFVKIVDFGVAKLVKEDPDLDDQEALTQRGSVVGTPGYIAPEVALRGVTTDARSDLYALGVVWFECLAGHAPFKARTATALLMAHALDPIPSLPAEIPLQVAGLVQRLLAKAPEDRPESAEELSLLIDALPAFESATSVPRARALSSLAPAEASAATVDDPHLRLSPQPSPSPPSPPPPRGLADDPTAPSALMQGARNAQDAVRLASLAVTEPPTLGAISTPSARPPQTPSRGSLLAAAALIGAAVIVAAVAMALLVRPGPGSLGVVDAGVAIAAASLDAGTVARESVAHVDAGAAKAAAAVDAGTRSKQHGKKPAQHDDGEHKPDIYN
ncbi:MAG TPA: serine/threonine-protein kinase [Myxococcota bacterium]